MEDFGGVALKMKKMPIETKYPEPESVPVVEFEPESEL